MPGSLHDRGDFARVGRDDQPDDPEDEGFACQRQEWLAREAAGAQPRRNDAEDGHGGTYKIRAVASSPEPKRLICWRLDVKRRRARCAENSPATASRARYRSTLGGTARRRSGGGGASSP